MKADFEKGTKVCSCCKRELPINEFWKDSSRNDGLFRICKECYYKKRKKNYIENVKKGLKQ